MKEQLLKQELKGGGIMDKDIKYINENIEDVYDAAKWLEKLDNRNRMLVKWTKFGEVIKRGDKNGI